MLNLNKHTETKPKSKPTLNVKNCSHVCVYYCVQLSYTTQHRTVLIMFPLILQTIIIAQMMSTGREGKRKWQKNIRQNSIRASAVTSEVHIYINWSGSSVTPLQPTHQLFAMAKCLATTPPPPLLLLRLRLRLLLLLLLLMLLHDSFTVTISDQQ